MDALSDFFHNLAINSRLPLATALFLGMVAALGPCTMTCNIAAIAYIGRRAVNSRTEALMSGLFYVLGRITSHALLGIIIIVIGLEVAGLRNFLEGVGIYFLGPFLLLVGLLMLLIDRVSFGNGGRMAALSARVSAWGLPGAFLMGFFFALAFCPYSALLFFAVMIPLALTVKGGILLPPVFALGSGLPVLFMAVLLSAGVTAISAWTQNLARFQRVVQLLMAAVFIGFGIYSIIKSIR